MTRRSVVICDTCHREFPSEGSMGVTGADAEPVYYDGELYGIQRHICGSCLKARDDAAIDNLFNELRRQLGLPEKEKP